MFCKQYRGINFIQLLALIAAYMQGNCKYTSKAFAARKTDSSALFGVARLSASL